MSEYLDQKDENVTQMTPLPMPFTETVIVCLVATILSFITTFGNLLVWVAVHMDKNVRTVSNLFIASLAVSDMLIGMISMPIYTTYIIKDKWPLGSLVCDLWMSFDYMMGLASHGNLLAICCDRYLSITQPLVYRIKRTPKLIKRVIVLVWAISILTVPPWIFAWPYIEGRRTVPDAECYNQFLESNVTIAAIITSIAFQLPMVIILVLYIKVYRETKRHKKHKTTIGTERGGGKYIDQRLRWVSSRTSSPDRPAVSIITKCKPTKHVDYEHDDKHQSVINETCMSFNDSMQDNSSPKLESLNGQEAAGVKKTSRPQVKERDNNKAAKILTVILMSLFITYVPYTVIAIIKPLCTDCIPTVLLELGYWMCYLNSTINPFIYACCNIHFRKAFWKILSCAWCKRGDRT